MKLIFRFWRLHRAFLVCVVVPIFSIASLAGVLFHLFDIVLNLTPSMPLGVYRAVGGEPVVGDLVYVNSKSINGLEVARERGYVVGRTMIKYLVGKEGDQVTISDQGVAINGILIKNSTIFLRDPAGRDIPSVARSGAIAKGKSWVMSDYNELSFDSRYFGEIASSSIRSRAKPLWTW